MKGPDKNPLMDPAARKLEESIRTRSRIFSHLSASILGLLFVFSLCQFELDGLKGILFDGLVRTERTKKPDPAIQLVAYDDESSRRHESSQRVPAEEIIAVLNALAGESPRAVALLLPINEKLYSDAELTQIGRALLKIENSFIGYTDDDSLGKAPPEALGISPSRYLPGFVSRDTFSYGADSVTRRVMLTIDGMETLYLRLSDLWNSGNTLASEKKLRAKPYGRANSLQTFIRWQGPPGTYSPFKSEAVAEQRLPKGSFAGKIVLVGSQIESKQDADCTYTPYSRVPHQTSTLEAAAHGLSTLMHNQGITRSSTAVDWILAFFVGLLTVNLVLYLAPGRGILFVLGEAGLLLAVGWGLLHWGNYWLNLAHPLVIAGVGYYLVIPYRLVDEYRKRWHFQEKSEFMVQLELLKSNFLSLISHDLKTPIARIQGNAELVLNRADKLDEPQRQCLEAIVQTTDDLSQYVETVLDLTRIESQQVPIQKTTKDINPIVMEVVESKRFLAQEKNIELVTKLEPLFSIKFDVKLIRRVLSNLVENAIKYSPPNSVITLASREENNWIRVTVTDQGVGITPEEQPKVFQKFYRCENETTRSNKGTGLGLYLVKYFIELHQGMVELRSDIGRGSEFTVSLPV